MKSDVLTSKSPRIDVHGETYDSVSLYVTQFIDDNYILGNRFIAIIHGKGEGVLKKRVHELLKVNKKVKDFYKNNWNIGETIIELDLDFDKKNKNSWHLFEKMIILRHKRKLDINIW